MDLRRISPVAVGDGEGPWLPSLLRAFLLRLQFTPHAGRDLGWRGVRPFAAHGEGLTCKVRSLPGVFGLLFEWETRDPSGVRGVFGLHYFPDPAEPRLDLFPLAALALAQQPDYWDQVREFSARLETRTLFRIGDLGVSASADGRSLSLGFTALTRQRVIALDGVALPDEPGSFLVAPGAAESDVAAYALCYSLFRVLAATVTRGLEESPSSLRLAVQPGWNFAYNAGGGWDRRMAPEIRVVDLDLGYGREDMPLHSLPKAEACSRLVVRRGDEPSALFRAAPWSETAATQIPENVAALVGLIVLTGFLGAGKTTLLRRYIEYNLQRDRFTAVIQNEIGEVGLDGKLLDHDYSVVEMDEGCVCCTLTGQLRRGLGRIMERFRPDVVVLETSGLANPENLLSELASMAETVRLKTVVTVVDAPGLDAALTDSAVARAQITSARVLILNKTDLATAAELSHAAKRLADLNPAALLLEASHGAIPFGLLEDAPPSSPTPRPNPFSLPAHPTHAADGYTSLTVRFETPLSPELFLPALRRAAQTVHRIKGIVDLHGQTTPSLIQAVAGNVESSPLPGADPGERFLVFIGRGPVQSAVAQFRQGLCP